MNTNDWCRFPLTVVIISRNQAKEVSEMIERIKDDNLEGCDIVFVDDHSEIAQFRKLSEAVEAWSAEREKKGLSTFSVTHYLNDWYCAGGARNFGASLGEGRYLWFVDGDDEICAGAISRIVKRVERDDAPDILLLPYSEGPDGEHLSVHNIEDDEACPQPFMWRIAPWGRVVSREVLDRFAEKVLFEDTDWHFRVCDRAKTRDFLRGRPCYIYKTAVEGSQLDGMRKLTDEAVAGRVMMVGRILDDLARGRLRSFTIRRYCKGFCNTLMQTVIGKIEEGAKNV